MVGDLAKSQQIDDFDCRGVLPDAHFGRAPLAPTMQGAPKLKNERQ